MEAVAVAARPTTEDRIRAALWFADHGFGVFSVWSTRNGICRCSRGPACDSPGKHPIDPDGRGGFHDATTDPDRIRTLLSAGSDPNYGLVNPEGVFAWDLDGEGWQDKLAGLEERLGALPPTLTTETANGEHRFFRWPEGRPRPAIAIFGWVTRWRSGPRAGYVIGPRSVHRSGRAYTPGRVFEIAEFPERWADAVLEELRPKAPGVIEVTAGGYQLPPFGYDGSRYDAIRNYQASRYMRGLERDEIYASGLTVLVPRFAQPLSEAEYRSRFDRAWEKVNERLGEPLPPPDEVASGEVQRRPRDDDELDFLPPPAAGEFPPPPDEIAFDGVLGECVRDLAPGTDASLVGLLGSVIAFAGALIPGQAYWTRTNTSSPFIALVGESGIGRKGTAMNRVRDAFANVWTEDRTVENSMIGGLNSGEALVTTLYNRREGRGDAVGLLFEEEYARLLTSRAREGSTLDPMMRMAFDGGPLENRKVGETKVVQPPYWLPALIGITPTELGQRLEPGALTSGSANRWLYLPVQKREERGRNLSPRFDNVQKNALRDARTRILRYPNPLDVDGLVHDRLAEYAEFLTMQSVGIARDLTRRLHVIAFRIALIHALVETDTTVRIGHLDRALAVTEYARRGLPWVFRSTLGDPVADLIYRHLLNDGPLTNRQITRDLCRDPQRRTAAIDHLIRYRLVERATVAPRGRKRTVLVATSQEVPWVPFLAPSVPVVHVFETRAEESNTASRSPNGTTAGQHGDIGVTTGGQHGDIGGQQGSWASPCLSYREHLGSHRQTPTGWVCDICKEG